MQRDVHPFRRGCRDDADLEGEPVADWQKGMQQGESASQCQLFCTPNSTVLLIEFKNYPPGALPLYFYESGGGKNAKIAKFERQKKGMF